MKKILGDRVSPEEYGQAAGMVFTSEGEKQLSKDHYVLAVLFQKDGVVQMLTPYAELPANQVVQVLREIADNIEQQGLIDG